MPANLDSCVSKVMGKGHDEKSAWAICKTSLDMTENKDDIEAITKYAEKMCDDMKTKNMSLEFGEINGIDIFAAGRWNGDEYTVDDLDKIVNSFEETKTKLKPYLKLGHGDKQGLLKADELPAAGFVQRVYRQGRKILADITHIPKKIFELIQRKAYSKVSVELYKDIPIEGKKHEWALKAIALLGGETPAVHDLDDIMNLYSDNNAILAFNTNAELRRYDVDLLAINIQEDKEMEELKKQLELSQEEIKKYTEENKALKEQVEKLNTEISEIKKFSEEIKKESDALKRDKKTAEVDARIKAFVEAKKILPVQIDKLKALILETPMEKEFSIGEKKYSSMEELIYAFVEEGDMKGLPTNESSEVGKKPVEDEDSRIKKYMADNKVSYEDAYVATAGGTK